jgi:hypothetical protein
MMKKLLALALVLGMAGIASAGLVVAGADVDTAAMTATISLSLEEGNISAYKLGLQWEKADVVVDLSGVAFPAVFDFAGKTQAEGAGGVANYAEITAGQFLSPPVEATAVLMDGLAVDYSAVPEGSLLQFVSKGGTTIDGTPVAAGEIVAEVFVPEPMTIGLLGLGALFLRRRK